MRRTESFPPFNDTTHLLYFIQAHHLDLDFYDKYFKKGAYLQTHADHFNDWHKGTNVKYPLIEQRATQRRTENKLNGKDAQTLAAFGQHVAHGATNFFDFAGWEMPMHFSSMEKEAAACRNSAILFDGHAMGELHIKGKDALKAVQKLCVNDISKAKPGMFVYTSLCKEDGGIFDDLVVFCLAENHYLLTVAAFNTHKTPAWVEKHTAGMDVCVMDMSAGTTCIEIQGPEVAPDHAEDCGFRLLECCTAILPFR